MCADEYITSKVCENKVSIEQMKREQTQKRERINDGFVGSHVEVTITYHF